MNYKNFLKGILFGSVSLITLTSCEPSTEYKKAVINKSSKDLTLIVKSNYPSEVDSISLKSGDYYFIINEQEMGYSEKHYSDCSGGNFELSFVHPVDSNEVYFHNSNEWSLLHSEINRGKNHWVTCEFEINDSDF